MTALKRTSQSECIIENINQSLEVVCGSPNIRLYLIPFASVTVMTAPDFSVSIMSCMMPSATLSVLGSG